jgi:hypothetical protein
MSRSRIKASSTIQISSPGVYKYHVCDAYSCSSPSKHALKSRSKKGNSHHYVLSSLCGCDSSFFPLLKTQIATHYVSVSAPALRTEMRHARLHVFWWRLNARYISLRQVGILRAFCSVRLWPHSLNLERKLQNSPSSARVLPFAPRAARRGLCISKTPEMKIACLRVCAQQNRVRTDHVRCQRSAPGLEAV